MAAIATVGDLEGAITRAREHPEARQAWLDQSRGLVFGTYPTVALAFDFVGGGLLHSELRIEPRAVEPKRRVSHLATAKRVREKFEIETSDEINETWSATQTLVVGLDLVEDRAPGTMERYSGERRRTRAVVAKSLDQLYDKPHLRSLSVRLKSGFFVATNNKSHEAVYFLREAIRMAGLQQEIIVRRAVR